jgi:RNA polymerase sigma factor (TIGR02999 family)
MRVCRRALAHARARRHYSREVIEATAARVGGARVLATLKRIPSGRLFPIMTVATFSRSRNFSWIVRAQDCRLCAQRLVSTVMSEFTRILSAIEEGDAHAAEQLLPLVYDELRKLAAQKLSQEKPGQTLQATALVHEAYVRLVDVQRAEHWNSRGHFFAAAAEAMRRILVDRARHRKSLKAGGAHQRVDMVDVATVTHDRFDDLLALHEALEKLEAKDKRKAGLVKLRFFAGFTNEQAAQVLGISTSTADNDWAYARSWLRLEIGGAATDRDA